jgi:tetratricopeptide (TPR) repeat protein
MHNNNQTHAKAERRIASILRQYVLSKPFQHVTSVASTMLHQSEEQQQHTNEEQQQQQEQTRTNSQQQQQHTSQQSQTNYDDEFIELFTQLETGKISVNQALDEMNEMLNVEEPDYNKVRYFAFQLFPYLQDDDSNTMDDDSNNSEQQHMRRAYRLIGLSYYKENEYERALAWFRKSARKSQSISDWFNLCTTAAQANQVELALHAFEQLEVLHKASKFTLRPSFWTQMYWFIVSLLNGQKYTLALEQLNRLKLAYKRARFTDTEYLKEIGLPAFEDFLSLSVTLFQRVNRSSQAIQFLKQMQENVDNSGRDIIQKMLENLKV